MKTIGLIIAMLFSVTSWGATPATTGLPGITLGGQFYTRDLEVVQCGNDTGGNETTCFWSNGVDGSDTQDFIIVGARLSTNNSTTNLFHCLGHYDDTDAGSLAVNGSLAGDGIYYGENGTGASGLTWFMGRDCQGVGGNEAIRTLFITEIAEAGNTGTINPEFGTNRVKTMTFGNLKLRVPANKRLMYTHTGGDNDTTSFFYGYFE